MTQARTSKRRLWQVGRTGTRSLFQGIQPLASRLQGGYRIMTDRVLDIDGTKLQDQPCVIGAILDRVTRSIAEVLERDAPHLGDAGAV